MEIEEMEEDDNQKIKQNKFIKWDLSGIELEHNKMSCLITDKDNYLVLYKYYTCRRSFYFVEWIKTSEQMKLIDKIEMDKIYDVKCLPNSNDLIVTTDKSLHYVQFDSDLNKLNKTKPKEYETGFVSEIENEYLFVYGEELGYMEMYKIEELKRDKQFNNPTIRIDKGIFSLCLPIESKYLIIGTKENELIVYKMNNLNDKPFASIQFSENIWGIISGEQYISIDYGNGTRNYGRLLSFKINSN